THPIRIRWNGAISRDRFASGSLSGRRSRTDMARYEFRLPDVGEGIAEAEIAAWHVKVGDVVQEEDLLVEILTDKATVEMESPVSGRILALAGAVGDQIAIGSVLVAIETEQQAAATTAKEAAPKPDATERRRDARREG